MASSEYTIGQDHREKVDCEPILFDFTSIGTRHQVQNEKQSYFEVGVEESRKLFLLDVTTPRKPQYEGNRIAPKAL